MPLLSWFAGDTHSTEVTVSNRAPDGSRTPVNLTDANCLLSVKGAGAGLAFQKVGTVSDPTTGKVLFTFAPADTVGMTPGVYAFDVQVTLAGGEVYTVIKDSLELLEGITP